VILLLVVCSHAAIFGFFSQNPDDRPLSPYIDKWVNKTHTIQTLYVGWTEKQQDLDKAFRLLLKIWNDVDHVPLMTWMPYAYNNWTIPNPNELIAKGAYDKYYSFW